MDECGDSLIGKQDLFQSSVGGAIPTSPLQLVFRKIGYRLAMSVVKEKHYLHRQCPCSFSFGAFFGNKILGVCTIGKPASHTLINGVCGKEKGKDVYELNRLWLDDICPKNSESRFLGWVLRSIPKGIVLVSYADNSFGHTGIVYRASNWIHVGKSIPFKDYTFGNLDHRSIPKDKRDKNKMIIKYRSPKDRYVYFTDKNDVKLLKWKTTAHQLMEKENEKR